MVGRAAARVGGEVREERGQVTPARGGPRVDHYTTKLLYYCTTELLYYFYFTTKKSYPRMTKPLKPYETRSAIQRSS